MTTREHVHTFKHVKLLDPAAYDSEQTSAKLDTLGWESASIVFDLGVVSTTGTSWAFKLTESDDDSTYTDVDSTQMEVFIDGAAGTTTTETVSTTSNDQKIYEISYVGGLKRYVKGVATPTGGSATLTFGAIGVLGYPRATVGTIK